MYGHLLSVLLMGMIPAWSADASTPPVASILSVAPPAYGGATTEPLQAIASRISASGAIVMDVRSGQVLFEKSADIERPMASLTKLMTALIVAEQDDLQAMVTVPKQAEEVGGNTVFLIPAGQTLTVGDLLSAALVASSNESAVALALHHSGTIPAFVDAMNARAHSLGLAHTGYQNPMGFDAASQTSTPRDLAWLALTVMRNPEIEQRMSTASTEIVSEQGKSFTLHHTHAMLHEDTSVIAGKTGTTDEAGQCLLSIVERGGRRYVVVLLHSRDRYADMRLIDPALPSD